MLRRLLYLAPLTIALAGACRSEHSAPLPRAAQPLDLLAAPTLAGPVLDVAPLRGKVVVVNFWSPY